MWSTVIDLVKLVLKMGCKCYSTLTNTLLLGNSNHLHMRWVRSSMGIWNNKRKCFKPNRMVLIMIVLTMKESMLRFTMTKWWRVMIDLPPLLTQLVDKWNPNQSSLMWTTNGCSRVTRIYLNKKKHQHHLNQRDPTTLIIKRSNLYHLLNQTSKLK